MVLIGDVIGKLYRARVNLRDALLAKQANKPEGEILKYQNTYREMAKIVDEDFKKLDAITDIPKKRKVLDAAMAGWADQQCVFGFEQIG